MRTSSARRVARGSACTPSAGPPPFFGCKEKEEESRVNRYGLLLYGLFSQYTVYSSIRLRSESANLLIRQRDLQNITVFPRAQHPTGKLRRRIASILDDMRGKTTIIRTFYYLLRLFDINATEQGANVIAGCRYEKRKKLKE